MNTTVPTPDKNDDHKSAAKRRSRWKQYRRVAMLNALKGASAAAGGTAVTFMAWWVQTH